MRRGFREKVGSGEVMEKSAFVRRYIESRCTTDCSLYMANLFSLPFFCSIPVCGSFILSLNLLRLFLSTGPIMNFLRIILSFFYTLHAITSYPGFPCPFSFDSPNFRYVNRPFHVLVFIFLSFFHSLVLFYPTPSLTPPSPAPFSVPYSHFVLAFF